MRPDLSPEQKSLLRETWQAVEPIADTAALLFYGRLFEIDPDIRRLFAGVDMAGQGNKLIQALESVIQGLDHLGELAPTIEALGQRHAGYGVTDGHYEAVGAALLWTLEQGLGTAFTPPVKQAWTTAYGLIANIMQRGARQVGEPTEHAHAVARSAA